MKLLVLTMKGVLMAMCLILLLGSVVATQTLPSSFVLKMHTGEQTGLPVFSLAPAGDAIAAHASLGKGFEAVGAVVSPEDGKYALTLMVARQHFVSSLGKDPGCSLILDGEKISYPEILTLPRMRIGRLLIENLAIELSKDAFFKLLKASDVTIRCEPVIYNLDGDNINALRYMAKRIERSVSEMQNCER